MVQHVEFEIFGRFETSSTANLLSGKLYGFTPPHNFSKPWGWQAWRNAVLARAHLHASLLLLVELDLDGTDMLPALTCSLVG